MAISDKLQKLIDGKQYVIDKTNAKAGTSLNIKSKWEELGDVIEGIESGESVLNSLKKLLDYTKSARNMFYGNIIITDLTGYIKYDDTENVTDMSYMFASCSELITIPQLNTNNVTNMSGMFQYCSELISVPQLDTSNVTDMSNIFQGCFKLVTIPQLNTNNVTNMSGMFQNCHKVLTSIPQLDTSKVTNISQTFNGCMVLEKIDITYYNISSTSSSSAMCNSCYSLKALIIRSFGANYTINSNAFNKCYHLTGTVNAKYNPNGDKDCYIYVPRSMVETLKSATNWSTYASQIRALEDYTIDGTTAGELDESKVNA